MEVEPMPKQQQHFQEVCVCSFLETFTCFGFLESKVHTYIHKLAASGDVIKIKEVLAENPTLVG